MPNSESNNIPAENLVDEDFIGALDDKESWAYFLCNVGDGDSQLVLLPRDGSDRRKAIVVDAYTDKVARLINELTDNDLLIQPEETEGKPAKDIALVVASHPHHDHISNMPNLFRTHGGRIAEFWDPGFYHPISAYTSLMNELQHRRREIGYAQPTAGLRRWIGGTLVTVLSPAVGLRNRFDSYGTEINDSSISIRIDHPAARKRTRDDQRRLIPVPGGASSLILGGDAQTLSWSYVMVDFPYLPSSKSEAARAIAAATGTKDLLNTDVVKISHHGSKRGVNLELMERFSASHVLVSSRSRDESSHGFPHRLTQELIREVKEPLATHVNPEERSFDWEQDVYYTHDRDSSSKELGSIGIVFNGETRNLWRFYDERRKPIKLANARRRV